LTVVDIATSTSVCATPTDAADVLDTAQALEHVPELLGLGPHLIAIATRSTPPQ
jgi:hypothetical protein